MFFSLCFFSLFRFNVVFFCFFLRFSCWPKIGQSRTKHFKGKVQVHQNHFHQKIFFIKIHFHQKPLSSKTNFIKKPLSSKCHFHQNHFHQKPISSKTNFIRDHFHQKPFSSEHFLSEGPTTRAIQHSPCLCESIAGRRPAMFSRKAR